MFYSPKQLQFGVLYLIYPAEYAKKNLPIYKLGVHQNLEPNISYKRYNSYENGSEIIYYFKINNLYENENKCIKKLITLGYKYQRGREYFTGNLVNIFNIIYNVIKNDIVELCNLDNDIYFDDKYNTFRKINIYFDENFNSKYLDYLKNKFNETEIINNYAYRMSHLKYLLYNYKNDILCNNGKLFISNDEDDEIETTNNEYETTNNEYETTNNEYETTNNEYEMTNNKYETTNNEYEITNNKYETTNNEYEITNNEKINNNIYNNKHKYTKENSGFICHRCFYISFTKSDMIKHCNKKNLCKTRYNCLYTEEEYKDLSIKKRYYFTEKGIDINEDILLNTTILIQLVTEFNDEINIIHNIYDLHNKNNYLNYNLYQNSILDLNKHNNQLIKKDNYIIYENGIKKFKCLICETIYMKKENLEKHLKNPKSCENKRIFNLLIIQQNMKLNNIENISS